MTSSATTKAKSRLSGSRSETASGPFDFVGFAFDSRIASSMISNAIIGPVTSIAASVRGCTSPKVASVVCGPNWNAADRPR